ncbi:hypothetical protein [Gordonibacter sp.]|uniref:hypothetical protein n=1 Tax=Gordonibacter sp. TaxID=1968902 RepID=UPI002FCA1EBE
MPIKNYTTKVPASNTVCEEVESTPWQWQFPPCEKFVPVDSPTRREQSLKIVEEAEEAMNARAGYSVFYVIELMDTIHACETALREFPESLLTDMKEAVICKNEQRGYYGESEVV